MMETQQRAQSGCSGCTMQQQQYRGADEAMRVRRIYCPLRTARIKMQKVYCVKKKLGRSSGLLDWISG